MSETPALQKLDICAERHWAGCRNIDIGEQNAPSGAPDEIVTIDNQGTPLLCLSLYYPGQEYHLATRLDLWRDWIVIGFGARVVLINLRDAGTRKISLSDQNPPDSFDYFCRIEATPEHLLVTSGQRIFRIGENAAVLWKSLPLGADGVIVSHIDSAGIIHGSGEWDPPGGWRSFKLSVETGLPVQTED